MLTDLSRLALLVQLSALESVEVIERSPPQTRQLADHLDFGFVVVFLRSEARWWLARQFNLSFSMSSLVSAEACVQAAKSTQR
jgi:hypothetical protein